MKNWRFIISQLSLSLAIMMYLMFKNVKENKLRSSFEILNKLYFTFNSKIKNN